MESIRTVAVIGAGVSGIVTAKHLEARGKAVTVFERAAHAGGVWVYDDRSALETNFTQQKPSTADFDPKQTSQDLSLQAAPYDTLRLLHAPPSPCYQSLTNNVATPQLALKDHPWPTGTEDFVNHRILGDYLQDAASKLQSTTWSFNTRVERVQKVESAWQVTTSRLLQEQGLECSKQYFDAVIVASGHYHAQNYPEIPGLIQWRKRWPKSVSHSKAYRSKDGFEGQNVLLIGGGVSAMDIAREIEPVAKTVYRSSRNGEFDIPGSFLPETVLKIGEVASFDAPRVDSPMDSPLDSDTTRDHDSSPASATVTLKDGTVLHNVHRVVICTGYVTSYPFLGQYHRDDLTPDQADETCLVTDGTQAHNLHKDIFYIPDATLAFIGKPYFTATFTLFEFQAVALAAVYSGIAALPSVADMRKEYDERAARKGTGKRFHSLRGEELEYVQGLVEWVNSGVAAKGLEPVQGHTEQYLASYALRAEKIKQRFEAKLEEARSLA